MFYANVDTYKVSQKWISQSNSDRLKLLRRVICDYPQLNDHPFEFESTKENGECIIKFAETPSASQRGAFLLSLENYLKKHVDIGITIWHSSLGDKNSLRKLRGVKVK